MKKEKKRKKRRNFISINNSIRHTNLKKMNITPEQLLKINVGLSQSLKETTSRGCNGASFHLDNVSVENSGYSGVYVNGTKRSTYHEEL